MATDRELLELAAKAAGRTYEEWAGGLWDPRRDSGQALELAVKLEMSVHATSHGTVVYVIIERDGDPYRLQFDEPWIPGDGTEMASTRRAIVRAAAEIGRALP